MIGKLGCSKRSAEDTYTCGASVSAEEEMCI